MFLSGIKFLLHTAENFLRWITIFIWVSKNLWGESQFCLTVPKRLRGKLPFVSVSKNLWGEWQFCFTVPKLLRGKLPFVSVSKNLWGEWQFSLTVPKSLRGELQFCLSVENFVGYSPCITNFLNFAAVFLVKVIFCEYFD